MDNLSNIPSVVREIQVSYSHSVKPSLLPKITNSNDAYQVLINYWNKNSIEFIEEFNIILLNRANKVLGISPISKGGLSGTFVDPKVIFSTALKANASAIILSHNHPSGNLKASESDIKLTKKLKEGSNLLDITILDHMIVTSEGYYSFADEGIL